MCRSPIWRSGLVMFLVTLLASSLGPHVQAQSDLPDLYEWAAPSVGALYVYDKDGGYVGEGSGFVLHDPLWPGLFATNFHVLDNGAYGEVYFGDGATASVTNVLFVDEAADIMVVEIEMDDSSAVRGLPLAKGLPRIGESIFAIGSPLGLTHSLHAGYVAQFRPIGDIEEAIQLNLDVAPGNSGGPLLNMQGEVMGIVTLRVQPHIASGMGFATIFNESTLPSPDNLRWAQQPLSLWDHGRRRMRAMDLIDLGWDKHAAGDLTGAWGAFSDAVEEDPQYARAWFGKAYALSDLGRRRDAMAAYNRVLELDPTDSAAHNNLGVQFAALDMQRDALHHYLQAISIDPLNPLYHRNAGATYLRMGRRDLAERAYEILRSLPDADEHARILFARLNI